MKISVLKEYRPYESRVALSPDMVKKLKAQGHAVFIESGAGDKACFSNDAYKKAGATLCDDLATLCKGAQVILKVQRPMDDQNRREMDFIQKETLLIGLLSPHAHSHDLKTYADKGITAMALELMPRISRAQAMDVLSSQSNLAGYRSVIEAAYLFNRAFPMMMTAAGTIAPARVMVIGAGVAGLQAIATAKRMGAIVSALDVRDAAKEQVESLGATFISVSGSNGEDTKGYASDMDDDYKKRQAMVIHDALKTQDIVITTALIPGKAAPRMIHQSMISTMKPGSVLLDMAVEFGGNIEGSIMGEVVHEHGVTLIGYPNLPSRIAQDASHLYARNVLNFLSLITHEGQLSYNWEDPILQGVTLTHEGQIIHPSFK